VNWDNEWHHSYVGTGWWLVMAIVMLAFWGGLAWLIVTLIRNGGATPRHPAASSAMSPQGERPDPEQLLHERLARGEIDVDEYHQRIDALRAKRLPPP
jgi:putative membrane protein